MNVSCQQMYLSVKSLKVFIVEEYSEYMSDNILINPLG